MAGLEVKSSGLLFLGNGQQNNFAFDFGKVPPGSSWIRPCVNHTSFSDRNAQLEYVSEFSFWDFNDPIPPFWGVTLRATGSSEFIFTLVLVTP
ncbi:hypothetical protein ACH4PU_04990 [Streptomyces sp. NPDC021100]|uniref:hypothetical protein n=1 Tax=Streptomyces sp. NPDC021100 TaxID=3365114 RepID=UPI0037A6BD69